MESTASAETVAADPRSTCESRSLLLFPSVTPDEYILSATAFTTNLSAFAASPPHACVSSADSVETRLATDDVATTSSAPPPVDASASGSTRAMSIDGSKPSAVTTMALASPGSTPAFLASAAATVVSGVTITFAKVASGPTGSAELRWSMPGAAFVNVSTHPGVDVETAICPFLFHAFVWGRTNPPSLSVTAVGSFQPAVPSPSRSTKTSHPAR